jgi:hypothetical protein
MDIPWELKRYIEAQRPNVVNFSAISARAESISDGTTTIHIDSNNKEFVFETFSGGVKKTIRFGINSGILREMTAIIFKSGTITGISTTSGSDPNIALAQTYALDVEDKFEKLEEKKADVTYVDSENELQNTEINLKAYTTYVDSANEYQDSIIEQKAYQTYVETELDIIHSHLQVTDQIDVGYFQITADSMNKLEEEVETLIQQNHFHGWFEEPEDLENIENETVGDIAYVWSTNTIWFWDDTQNI